jgi:uncharacterized Zn finger protein
LQGEVTAEGDWEQDSPWCAHDLAVARLQALERQRRYQEYLYLARAEGQTGLYVTMLLRLGRVQEAVASALTDLTTTNEALMVAQALRQQGDPAAALRVAERGLTLAGEKESLADWLCQLASGMGDTECALQAAVVAFQAFPSLDAYLQVQRLAAGRWPDLRAELLACARQTGSYIPQAQVDIFLHEGLIDEAIAAVQKVTTYDLLERVVDAAADCRPDWVIEVACQQAERIIVPGVSAHYDHAIGWLEKARKAYLASNRQAEWQAYLLAIRTRHLRKYRLMEMLDRLDS